MYVDKSHVTWYCDSVNMTIRVDSVRYHIEIGG